MAKNLQTFIKEFPNPAAIAANNFWEIQINSRKLSEGMPGVFVPCLGTAILNKSANNIKVFINETEDNALRLTPNSSRGMEGIPIWDMSVRNLDAAEIAMGEIVVTNYNDMEQTSRYNASIKSKRGF